MTDLLDPPRSDEAGAPDRPRMDPRFARRWIDARREEGRHRLHLLLWAGGAAGVALLAVGSLFSPLFDVRHLRVAVNGPIPAASISRLAGVSGHTLMIEVNGPAAQRRLDADPWLGAARVTRHWPGTVLIQVTVRTPVAVVAAGSRWAEVDRTGRVLTDVAAPPPAMPVLQGVAAVPPPGGWLPGSAGPSADPDAPPARLADVSAPADGPDVPSGAGAELALLDSLPATLLPDVVSVGGGAPTGVSLVISPPRLAVGTITVAFGDGSQLQSKVTALLTLLAQADLGRVDHLDLSVPNRPAAGVPAPPTTVAPTTTTTAPTTTTVQAGPDSSPTTATTSPGSGGTGVGPGGLDGA